ncbi:hypothetical protein PPACK8108_LOCUS2689 [Phakopsora pachyrhizi]|uniref:Uncharacterized protein n=1 Tax=Phakopsora pachyrhizi TaxID=170000 RepID=A0AAV0AK93_PHAPC|nr:hypothetical protein PPACK8108_LOCUS2689 [Phakopsora pachyrhizi]
MVESGHQVIKDVLVKMCGKSGAKWEISTKRTTGYSPYKLMFGQPALLPVDVRIAEERLAGRVDQLARKKEVLELGYKRMMEARAKLVRYWDSRMAHGLREPLVPGDMVLAYNKSLEDQWGKLFHNQWNGLYRVVEQAPVKSYVLEELDGTRMAWRFADQEEEERMEDVLSEPNRASGGKTGLDWVFELEPGFWIRTRLSEVGPGQVISGRGQNMTPGEILPGVQKSGQIFDSCSGRTSDGKTMQGVLDWVRAGRNGCGWGSEMTWKDGRWKRCKEEAGGGCGGRIGKRGQAKGGAEMPVEGNEWRHYKEEQKLGGGAHQGQSYWSKTTGAMDL